MRITMRHFNFAFVALTFVSCANDFVVVPPQMATLESVSPGMELYLQHCSSCHGTNPNNGGYSLPLTVDAVNAQFQTNPTMEPLQGTISSQDLQTIVDTINN